MTPAEARAAILVIFCGDRSILTVDLWKRIRQGQPTYEPMSETLFRLAGIPYPGPDYVGKNPESIRLLVAAAAAVETLEAAHGEDDASAAYAEALEEEGGA